MWESEKLGLADEAGLLIGTRKGTLASVVKARTSIGNESLAQRFEMGHYPR